jgi:signal transduction histidine kinase
MQRAQDIELETNAAAVAALLAQAIQTQIDGQELHALQLWADRDDPKGQGGSAWQSDAERFLEEHPTFGALVRVDYRGHAGDGAGEPDARKALQASLAETLASSDKRAPCAVVGPIPLTARSIAAKADAPERRVVFALLEPAVALQPLIGHSASGYSIRVMCGSRELFRAVPAGSDARLDRYWQAADVALSSSPSWTLKVHPTALLVAGARNGGLLLVLITGFSISVLLAALMHVSLIARLRGLTLVRVEAELSQSMNETRSEVAAVDELGCTLETRVAERTAVLRDTISELETFNYSVAHDLRSPMGAVINFAGIIAHDHGAALDEEAKQYLRRIAASASNAVALMNGLLAFSHSGREEISKCNIDMRDLVEGVRDDLAASGVDPATIEIAQMPSAYADPSMIRRVFSNLISNAVKFTKPGEPASVRVGGSVGEDKELVYFVRDRGIGFDMRYAHKLFGVFERLHSSTRFDGHGVGLAISARLIRRHGGRIWAEAAVDQGATFHFTLPRSDAGREVKADGTTEV